MRILVTGANGFVGNHVINYLISKEYSVIASSRNEQKARKSSWYHSVQFIPFDICSDFENVTLYDYFGKPDILIHLAWDGLPNYNDSIHFEKNLFFQYKFLTNYIDSGGKHVLVTGTCFEYGLQNGCLSEEIIPNPVTAYGIAKDSLRRFLQVRYAQDSSLIFQWVRLFYMYGYGQHPKSIMAQLTTAIEMGDSGFNMSEGKQTRDYLKIEKVAEYICEIGFQKEISGIVNCCSGNPITIRELVENHLASISATIKLNFGQYPYNIYEPMHFWGNNCRLKTILK